MTVIPLKRGNSPVMLAVKGNTKRSGKAKVYDGQRQSLSRADLDKLFAALKANRHGKRDYLLALVSVLHALRVSEVIGLKWGDIDFRSHTITIARLKGSISGQQYLEADEERLLKALKKAQQGLDADHVFQSERGGALSRFGVYDMIRAAGTKAGFKWELHPHVLRHSALQIQADAGATEFQIRQLAGHASAASAQHYVKVSPAPLKNIWRGKR